MARTYQTLSLSLHPDVCRQLGARGDKVGKTAARIAAEIVMSELALRPHAADGVESTPDSALDEALVVEGAFCWCLVERAEGERGLPTLGREIVHLARATCLRDVITGAGCEIRLGQEWIRVRAEADLLYAAWRQCASA